MSPLEQDDEPPLGSAEDAAIHNDPRLLRALIRVLEEKQFIAPGEVQAMVRKAFEELVSDQQKNLKESMRANMQKCLEILKNPDLSEVDRIHRQNLLDYYEKQVGM